MVYIDGMTKESEFKDLVEKYLESTLAGKTSWASVFKDGKDVGKSFRREGVVAPAEMEGYSVELYKHEGEDSFMWLLCHDRSDPPIFTWIPREEDEEFYNIVQEIWDLAFQKMLY